MTASNINPDKIYVLDPDTKYTECPYCNEIAYTKTLDTYSTHPVYGEFSNGHYKECCACGFGRKVHNCPFDTIGGCATHYPRIKGWVGDCMCYEHGDTCDICLSESYQEAEQRIIDQRADEAAKKEAAASLLKPVTGNSRCAPCQIAGNDECHCFIPNSIAQPCDDIPF